jgi:hypothetical protein
MHAYMCVYGYVYVYVYLSYWVRMFPLGAIKVRIYEYTCIHVFMWVCISRYIWIYGYLNTYSGMYTSHFIGPYICIYTYINMYTSYLNTYSDHTYAYTRMLICIHHTWIHIQARIQATPYDLRKGWVQTAKIIYKEGEWFISR